MVRVFPTTPRTSGDSRSLLSVLWHVFYRGDNNACCSLVYYVVNLGRGWVTVQERRGGRGHGTGRKGPAAKLHSTVRLGMQPTCPPTSQVRQLKVFRPSWLAGQRAGTDSIARPTDQSRSSSGKQRAAATKQEARTKKQQAGARDIHSTTKTT